MPSSNDAIKALLGTTGGAPVGTSETSNPAIKNIATNGALLIQNVSKLSETLTALKKSWGG